MSQLITKSFTNQTGDYFIQFLKWMKAFFNTSVHCDRWIVLCFLTICSNVTNGQVKLDLGTGVNISSVHTSQQLSLHSSASINYFVAVSPTFPLKDKWRLRQEIQISKKGYVISSANSQRVKYTYLDIMPQVVYSITEGISLAIGPYLGIALGEIHQIKTGSSQPGIKMNTIKHSDHGISLIFFTRINKILLSLGGTIGLTNIENQQFLGPSGEVLPHITKKNRNIQVGIYYSL